MLPLLVVLVGAGVEETVGSHHGGGRKQQDVQEDILKAMKDSGVLNEWQEKLEEQLFPEENEVKSGARKNVKKPVISPQEKEMLRSFVDEYKSDSSLTVDTDVILGIVERVQKTPKPNLPQIFVQLGPIIEVVSAITQKTKDVQKIVDRQSPVFDSPAKPKDVLQTLAENLKSELVRLTLDSPPKGGPARKKSKSPPKPAPAAPKMGGLDMADYLKLGANLMKGGNAAQMMKMMSGEMDMAGMIEMLPQLMEGGNVKDLLLKMAGSYLESSPYGALIQQYGKQAMDSPAGSAFLDNAWKVVEDFIKSENGKRFMKLVPGLMAAKDMDETLALLSKEAEINWGEFFTKIQNSDYKSSALEATADYMVQGYDFVVNPPKDSMISKVPVVLNGLLVSQRLPTIDMKNPVDSLTKIANKAIKLFTTWKLDLTPHVKEVKETLAQIYEKQAKGNKFEKLSAKEKRTLLARILEEEFVNPIQVVWQVYQHVSNGKPQCSEHLLCMVNHREFRNLKPLRPTESSPTRLAVTKAASLGVAWTLAKGDKEEYWRLYRAIYEGAQGTDCSIRFSSPAKGCDLFPWQRQDFMNTQYDHVEL